MLTGAALCEAEGYPLGSYLEHLEAVKPVVEGSIGDLVRRMEAHDFGGERSQATVEACGVALRHLVTICREHGIDGALPAAFDRLVQTAIEAGHAGDDFAALARFVRRSATDGVVAARAAEP